MSYKLKFTRVLLDTVFKYPFIFPKRLHFFAEQYHSNSDFILNKKNKPRTYKTASLLESNFFWNAISFTVLMNNEELVKLKRWKEKKSLRPTSSSLSNIISPTSFDREGGWAHIGIIRINEDSFVDDMASIHMNSLYLDMCLITLKKYSSGLSAVTIYISLKDIATNLVKSVTPPVMEHFVELESLNFLKRKNNAMYEVGESTFCEEFLKKNVGKVYDEAWELFQIIQREVNLKINRQDVYCVSDMYLDQVAPYFNMDSNQEAQDEFILLRKFMHFSDKKLSINESESFIMHSRFNYGYFDMTYLNINPESSFQEYNNPRRRLCSNSDSHLAVIPLLLIIKKVDALSKKINKLKLYDNSSMAKSHESLFLLVHELEIIGGWYKSLSKELPLSLLSGYKDKVDSILEYQAERAENLLRTVRSFYSLSENRIQISNIKYSKRYSHVVFVFILIQVTLAAMTIDFDKHEAWYAPVIIFLKSFF